MELIKNKRFRTGNAVDIYHTPVAENYTADIQDYSIGNDYQIKAYFEDDLSIEQFGVGDLCALSFGVGEIASIDGNVSYVGNLSLNSETFTESSWVKTGVTATLSYVKLFNGSPTYKLASSVGTSEHSITQTITKAAVASNYTFSAYMSPYELDHFFIRIKDINGSSVLIFDGETNSVLSVNTTGSFVLVDSGFTNEVDGWKRIYITVTTSDDTSLEVTCGLSVFGNFNFLGDGTSGVLLAKTQLNKDGLGDYISADFVAKEPKPYTSSVNVTFPNSMFPDYDVAKYVGNEVQHCLFFLKTGRVEANFTVANYKESVAQAAYGYAKVVYNLQTQAELILTPIRLVDDGLLSKIMYSKGFVLGACDVENYTPTTVWNQDFPLELSGTSIDPIYRRAFLTKRESESKGRKSKATMTFRLIG